MNSDDKRHNAIVKHLKACSDAEFLDAIESEEKLMTLFNELNNIQGLVELSKKLPLERYERLIQKMAPLLPFDKSITAYQALCYNLESLLWSAFEIDRFTIAVKALSDRLVNTLKKASYYHRFVFIYPPEYIEQLNLIFKDRFIDMITDSEDLCRLLCLLNLTDYKTIYTKMKTLESKQTIALSIEDYKYFIDHVSIDKFKAYLFEFSDVFYQCVISNQNNFDALIDNLFGDDDESVYSDIDINVSENEVMKAIFECYEDKLTTEQKLKSLPLLSNEYKYKVYEESKKNGALLKIDNATNFLRRYTSLNETYKADYYSLIKKEIPSFITNEHEFSALMGVLSEKQQLEQIEYLGPEKIESFLVSSKSLSNIVPYLAPSRRNAFIQECIKSKQLLIKTVTNYMDVLAVLPDENLEEFQREIESQDEKLSLFGDRNLWMSVSMITLVRKREYDFLERCFPYILETIFSQLPEAYKFSSMSSIYSDDIPRPLLELPAIKSVFEKQLTDSEKVVSFYLELYSGAQSAFVKTHRAFLFEKLANLSELREFLVALLSHFKGDTYLFESLDEQARVNFEGHIKTFSPVIVEAIRSNQRFIRLFKGLTYTARRELSRTLFPIYYEKLNQLSLTIPNIEKLYQLLDIFDKENLYLLLKAQGAVFASKMTKTRSFKLLLKIYKEAFGVDYGFRLQKTYRKKGIQRLLFHHLNPSIRGIIISPLQLNQYLRLFNTFSADTVLKKIDPEQLKIKGWQDIFTILENLSESQTNKLLKRVMFLEDNKELFSTQSFLNHFDVLRDEQVGLLFKIHGARIQEMFWSSPDNMCLLIERCNQDIRSSMSWSSSWFGKKTYTLPRSKQIVLTHLAKCDAIDSDYMLQLVDKLNKVQLTPDIYKILAQYLHQQFLDAFKQDKNPSHLSFYRALFDARKQVTWETVSKLLPGTQMIKGSFSRFRIAEYSLYYTLWDEIQALEAIDYTVALGVQLAFAKLVDTFKVKGQKGLTIAIKQALNTPDSALYCALNTHTSRVPVTLFSIRGEFGFFSFDTNVLRRIRIESGVDQLPRP